MIPPVEVPAIRSNSSAVCLPVRSSRSASTIAGITPRMPPPSTDRTFIRRRPYRDRVPWVYLLRCADDTLYCGWTVDLDKRLAAHNAGTASRYTRRRLPVELAWSQQHPDRSSAMRAEAAIKQLPRPEKLALVSGTGSQRGD